MPKLSIDMFDDAPKVGDKVKVLGKVKFIDEDSGEVEVSYDDVSIVKKSRKKRDNDDDDDRDYDDDDVVVMDMQAMPPSQRLDAALAESFPNNQ